MQQTFRKSTIKDVAKMASVSTSTISAFVSGRESVCSAETAERIRQAVVELRYTPNSLTQGLRKARTRTVGVAFDQPSRTDPGVQNSFIERAWHGILAEADDQRHAVLYYPHFIRSEELFHQYLDGRADGLIFNLGVEDTIASYIASAGIPAVLLGRSPENAGGCAVVYADERETLDLALTHLWTRGHRHIGFLAGPDVAWRCEDGYEEKSSCVAQRRRAAFREWMAARGHYSDGLIQEGRTWTGQFGVVASAFDAWRGLAEPFPSAILCANDHLAMALRQVANVRGLKVPEDLSIVGIDNIRPVAELRPWLTSVEIDAEALGRQAVKSLLRIVEGAKPDECHAMMSVSRLIVRDSTGEFQGDCI